MKSSIYYYNGEIMATVVSLDDDTFLQLFTISFSYRRPKHPTYRLDESEFEQRVEEYPHNQRSIYSIDSIHFYPKSHGHPNIGILYLHHDERPVQWRKSYDAARPWAKIVHYVVFGRVLLPLDADVSKWQLELSQQLSKGKWM